MKKISRLQAGRGIEKIDVHGKDNLQGQSKIGLVQCTFNYCVEKIDDNNTRRDKEE